MAINIDGKQYDETKLDEKCKTSVINCSAISWLKCKTSVFICSKRKAFFFWISFKSKNSSITTFLNVKLQYIPDFPRRSFTQIFTGP